MSGSIVAKDSKNGDVSFSCKWHVNENPTVVGSAGATLWQTVDLFLTREGDTVPGVSLVDRTNEISLKVEGHDLADENSSVVNRFFLKALSAADTSLGSTVRLVVPRTAGQVVRSDILELRLLDCPGAALVASFAEPLQTFTGDQVQITTPEQLRQTISSAVGAVLLENVQGSIDARSKSLADLDAELLNRLSFPWISSEVRPRKTLALVEGGRRPPGLGGNGETVFQAAYALGIDMIVIDNPGHWLDGPKYASWRKDFIGIHCDLQSDSVFAKRVVDAIRSWGGHLDGLVTFCDHYKEPVAEAAQELGLSTHPPSAFALATDKYRLRRFEGHDAYLAGTLEEAVNIVEQHDLKFPLIVKPVVGFLSEGVTRLDSLEQLKSGISIIDPDRHGAAFAIERYCDGPEVDANFVICDGDLLFHEISDEFPKGADANSYGNVKTFIEHGNVLPSKLPQAELAVLKQSLYQSLLRLGFRDGVFHLEARVMQSRMEYATRDGVFDLISRDETREEAPEAWLIEVNPRPPAIMSSDATKHTYGIDYWGLGLLFGLSDGPRARQLSHPYAQNAQYWCQMVFIPAEKGGVYNSEDACAELLERRPELKQCVSWYANYFPKGAVVPDPHSGINCWIAHFNVFSRTSRTHVLELGETVRKEFQYLTN